MIRPYGRAKGKCRQCGGYFTGDHPQVGLTDEYGVHTHVDKGIAPLVAACWAVGIQTASSCQGGPDEPAILGFPAGSAESFARAATSTDRPEVLEATPEDALDWRIYGLGDPGGWRWVPGYPWDPGFVVYFPPSDIPELTRRLQAKAQVFER